MGNIIIFILLYFLGRLPDKHWFRVWGMKFNVYYASTLHSGFKAVNIILILRDIISSYFVKYKEIDHFG